MATFESKSDSKEDALIFELSAVNRELGTCKIQNSELLAYNDLLNSKISDLDQTSKESLNINQCLEREIQRLTEDNDELTQINQKLKTQNIETIQFYESKITELTEISENMFKREMLIQSIDRRTEQRLFFSKIDKLKEEHDENLKKQLESQFEKLKTENEDNLEKLKKEMKLQLNEKDKQKKIIQDKTDVIRNFAKRLQCELEDERVSTKNAKEKEREAWQVVNEKEIELLQLAELGRIPEALKELFSELSCCVCMEYIVEAKTLNCSHSFCSQCIGNWRRDNYNCPNCRADITEEVPTLIIDNLVQKINECEALNSIVVGNNNSRN